MSGTTPWPSLHPSHHHGDLGALSVGAARHHLAGSREPSASLGGPLVAVPRPRRACGSSSGTLPAAGLQPQAPPNPPGAFGLRSGWTLRLSPRVATWGRAAFPGGGRQGPGPTLPQPRAPRCQLSPGVRGRHLHSAACRAPGLGGEWGAEMGGPTRQKALPTMPGSGISSPKEDRTPLPPWASPQRNSPGPAPPELPPSSQE